MARLAIREFAEGHEAGGEFDRRRPQGEDPLADRGCRFVSFGSRPDAPRRQEHCAAVLMPLPQRPHDVRERWGVLAVGPKEDRQVWQAARGRLRSLERRGRDPAAEAYRDAGPRPRRQSPWPGPDRGQPGRGGGRAR